MRARFYRPDDAPRWDAFCAGSYCATFLHTRRFLSYHGERFQDCSIVVEDDATWLAVVPMAIHPDRADTAVSHPGLSFGGVVHQGGLRGAAMIEALRAIASLLRSSGLEQLQYKALPHIYHRAPAQDDIYALHRLGARAYRCDLSTCVDLGGRLPVSSRRRRSLQKARNAGLVLDAGAAWIAGLWRVVEDNLSRRHGVRPTHSQAEIALLAERFPADIEVRVARSGDEVAAGVVLFKSTPVVHAQYLAASPLGLASSALDLVIEASIADAGAANRRYFDFGISTEDAGSRLNDGLYGFKSEFGGSGLVHAFYALDLRGVS